MKYRGDFVTNSSSSSYIVAYKNTNDMIDAITEFVHKYMGDLTDYDSLDLEYNYEARQYATVISDIFIHQLSYEKGIEKIRDFAEDACWMKFAQKYDREKYKSQSEWYHSEECQDLCKKYIDSVVEKFKLEYPEGSFISYLYYSDSSSMYEVKDSLDEKLKGVFISKQGD